MLRKYYNEEKVHINFLYSNSGNMSKVKKDINKNPINCEQEYLNKCIKIRNLFLQRIDKNMDSSTYYGYKECFKHINSGTHIFIDNIITLLEQDDKTLINLVNNEKNNYNYYYIYQYKKNNHLNDNDILPSEISIALIKDIYTRMINTIREFAYKLAAKEFFQDKERKLDAFFEDGITYHIVTTILREKIIDEYSYLDETLYSDIYQNLLNNLHQEFNRHLRTSYNYIFSFENRNNREVAFNQKKKNKYM